MSARKPSRPAPRETLKERPRPQPADAAKERRRAAPSGADSATPAAPEPAASRAAVVLAIGLAVLLLLRAWGTLAPGMGAWGLNHARFLAPAFGWPLWALAALALVPWLARPLVPAFTRLGDALARRPVALAPVAALLAAAIVLAFPDRLRFVGDFLLRQGTVEEGGRPGRLFPQALPLDVFLHVTLPTGLLDRFGVDANTAARAIGACEAALLAILAVALVRVLALRGAAAIAAASLVWWSGALTMFTGYSKAFGELTLLVVAAALFALRSARRHTPPLGLGIVFAIGLVLHRSAIGLLPLVAVTWILWARPFDANAKRPVVWAALAIPLLTLGAMAPRLVATFLRWDAVHLTPAEVKQHGGPLLAAFAGRRPQDLANLALVLVPVAPACLAALVALNGGLPRRREALVLLALVLPLAGTVPFIHPAQGLFRDWDDFAATGAAVAVACAWVTAEILRGAPRFAWLAPGLVLAALVPSLQWVAVQSDLARGLVRVQALAEGPPRREGPEWGGTWDYLGIRNYRLENWDASAAAFAHAAETSPSPRILTQWALAESNRGNHQTAQGLYRRLLAGSPDDYAAWRGLASESAMISDSSGSREAAQQMLRLRPGDPAARTLLQSLEEYERRRGAGGAARP